MQGGVFFVAGVMKEEHFGNANIWHASRPGAMNEASLLMPELEVR